MRIAYLGQMADVATENGISKKILTQTTEWMRRGHATRYFALTPTSQVWTGFPAGFARVRRRGTPGWRLLQSWLLTRDIRAYQPDVIYFRYAHHSAGLPRLFRDFPAVAEINSDDQAEYPLTLTPLKNAYHRATRSRVLRNVTAFVAVTHELGARFTEFGKPTEVIANGIDLANEPVLEPAGGDRASLVFVGSEGSPWHGLERLLEIARLLPEADFVVIGCRALGSATPSNVRFMGPLTRAEYEPILRSATAAVGTLALFRKRMDEACPLKVREYLSLGLPVIAAYRDTDIPDDAEYFLRLPNNDEPLASQLPRIREWLTRWRGRRVAHDAVRHLDTRVKEQARLAFLARFARAAAS